MAIKRFKSETANLNTLKHELNVMVKLHHENLVNLVDVRDKATYKKKTGVTYSHLIIQISLLRNHLRVCWRR